MKLNRKFALFFFASLFGLALLMIRATRVSAAPHRAPAHTWGS